jgi:hypothetical protein
MAPPADWHIIGTEALKLIERVYDEIDQTQKNRGFH